MSQKAFVRPQSWSQTKRTTIRKVGQFRFSCAYAQGQCALVSTPSQPQEGGLHPHGRVQGKGIERDPGALVP